MEGTGTNYMAEEVFDELMGRSEKDEFVMGSMHNHQLPEDITDALETIFFLKGYSNVTIKVSKESTDPNDPHLKFFVIDRS